MSAPSAAVTLDAVNQAIHDLVTGGLSSYTIGNQTFTHLNLGELVKLRDSLVGLVAAQTGRKRTVVQFERPT